MTHLNDFEALGFLADLPDDRAARKARFQVRFDTCYRLAHDATRLARFLIAQRITEPHQQVAAALWVRCVAAGQGAVLLAERGLPAEAGSLARSSLECLFWGVALVADAKVLQLLMDNDRASAKKAANGMLSLADVAQHLSEEDRAVLREKGGSEAVASTSVAKVAELAGLDYLYQSAYRGLSRWGVHAGIATASFSMQDNRLAFAPTDTFVVQVLEAVEQGVGAEGLPRFAEFANALAAAAA